MGYPDTLEFDIAVQTYQTKNRGTVEGTVKTHVPVLNKTFLAVAVLESKDSPNIEILSDYERPEIATLFIKWKRYYDEVICFLKTRGYPTEVNGVFLHNGQVLSLDFYLMILGTESDNNEMVLVGDILRCLRKIYFFLDHDDTATALASTLDLVGLYANLELLLQERSSVVGIGQLAGGQKGTNTKKVDFGLWSARAQELADVKFKDNPRISLERCAEKIKPDLDDFFTNSDVNVPKAKRIAAVIKNKYR
jgi:hypothetical protein